MEILKYERATRSDRGIVRLEEAPFFRDQNKDETDDRDGEISRDHRQCCPVEGLADAGADQRAADRAHEAEDGRCRACDMAKRLHRKRIEIGPDPAELEHC